MASGPPTTAGRTAGVAASMHPSGGAPRCPAAAPAPSRSGRSSSRRRRLPSVSGPRCSPQSFSAHQPPPTRRRSRRSPRASSRAVTSSSRCSSSPLPPARASEGAPHMNADPVANFDLPVPCAVRAARTLRRLAAVALLAVLAACSGGGGPGVTVNQPTGSATVDAYTGPPAQNADVLAFQINLWQNIIPTDRCGGCHHQGGQSPMFARSDDVNLAYQAALPLVNLTNPSLSTLVVRVGSGHNCWVADPSACAATMLVWIQNWIGSGSSSTSSIQLIAPPVQAAGGGKQFPASATAGSPSYAQTVYPVVTQFCSGCHNPTSATAQPPYFADPNPADLQAAYVAAQPKINLATPNLSRFYQRLADDMHHCWPTPSSGGAPDCPGSAAAMLAQLTAFANGIPVTPIDPSLVV